MSLEQLSSWSQVIASVAVFVSLLFVGYELRMSTRVASAQARHSLSLFAGEISRFKAENADRLAKVHGPEGQADSLTEGDQLFRFWDHVQLLMHAETFFRHFQLGLMPQSHWDGYCRFFTGYAATPGFAECWRQMRISVSADFADWVDARSLTAVSPGG
jgi:hypothetical protein